MLFAQCWWVLASSTGWPAYQKASIKLQSISSDAHRKRSNNQLKYRNGKPFENAMLCTFCLGTFEKIWLCRMTQTNCRLFDFTLPVMSIYLIIRIKCMTFSLNIGHATCKNTYLIIKLNEKTKSIYIQTKATMGCYTLCGWWWWWWCCCACQNLWRHCVLKWQRLQNIFYCVLLDWIENQFCSLCKNKMKWNKIN